VSKLCLLLPQPVLQVVGNQAAPVVPEPGSIVIAKVCGARARPAFTSYDTAGALCAVPAPATATVQRLSQRTFDLTSFGRLWCAFYGPGNLCCSSAGCVATPCKQYGAPRLSS